MLCLSISYEMQDRSSSQNLLLSERVPPAKVSPLHKILCFLHLSDLLIFKSHQGVLLYSVNQLRKRHKGCFFFFLNIMDSWNLHVLTMRISALSRIETLSSENMKSGCLTACDFQQSRNGWLSYRPYVPSVSQCEFIRKLRHLKEQSCVGNWMEPFVMASLSLFRLN